MQQQPVVVRESNSSGPAMVGILAIVVIAAIALFFWQPWNASATHTTIINQQPAGTSGGSNSSTTGGTTSGSSGTTSGSASGTTSGASH